MTRNYLFSLVGLFLLLTACSGPITPELKELKNIRFKSVSFDGDPSVVFAADAILNNPNPIGVNVSGLEFDVYADDKLTTHISQNLVSEIKGNSEFTLPLNFKIPVKEIYKDQNFNPLELLKPRTIQLKVDGYIKLLIGNVEFRIPVEHEEPYKVSLGSLFK